MTGATAGDTIRIRAGTYPRGASGKVALIMKPLTLVGAGTGEDGARLQGDPSRAAHDPLIDTAANDPSTIEFRDPTMTGGYNSSLGGGGVFVTANVTVILTRVLVTGNKAPSGGGIWVNENGTLIVNAGATVTNNTGLKDGGGISNQGKVTLNTGSGTGCPS